MNDLIFHLKILDKEQAIPNICLLTSRWTNVVYLHCYCFVVKWCPAFCNPMNWSSPDFLVLHYLLEFVQTHVHWVSDVIQPSHPLLPPSPPCPQSFPASRSFPMCCLFTSGGQIWSFSFSISPSNKYSGLISIRIDWFDLCAVQGTLKNVLQHHTSKASVLRRKGIPA